MKNDDKIIEAIPWIKPFIDVWTMNIYQKIVILFFEKTMKAYFKAVILSLKIYENILKFNFLMGGYYAYWIFTQMLWSGHLSV